MSNISIIYWGLGDLEKAADAAQECYLLSSKFPNDNFYITASDRLALILAENGQLKNSLNIALQTKSLIKENNIQDKAYSYALIKPSVDANISRLYAELGDEENSLNYQSSSYSGEDSFDLFTYLYVTTLSGYSLYTLGKFSELLPKLEKCLDIHKEANACVLAPVFLSMYGACLSYLGSPKVGANYINKARKITKELNQGHKTGMISLFYLENLLLQFKTDEFSKMIDQEIKRAIHTHQHSFSGWLFLLKAIYFCYFKKSKTGYLSAIAKAHNIARNHNMKLLEANLDYLLHDTMSGVFSHEVFKPEDKDESKPSFLKAQFFHNMTSNIQTLPSSIR